jgi:AAA family ATP:ADP antiporter
MTRADLPSRLMAAVGDVRPGEGGLVAIFMGFTFFQGLSAELVWIAAYSLFLDTYDATMLPWVYMGLAVAVTASSFVYRKVGEWLPLKHFLPFVVSFSAISLGAIWFALWLSPHPWLRLALPIWIEVVAFLNGMVFWELADRIFDIRQAKRLFGSVLSVAFLAGIVAGLGAAVITGFIGATHVVGLSCIAGLGLVAITFRIQKNYATHLASNGSDEIDASEPVKGEISLRKIAKHRLASLIFFMVGITIIEFFILDIVFFDFADKRYPDEAAFAVFYGTFSAAVNLVSWIMLGFVTNRVMSRFGVGVSLLIMPAAVLFVMVIAGGVEFSGEYAIVLFWLVIAGKFCDDVLAPSFNEASASVLYQALPQRYRSRARSFGDGVIYPVCAGVAGLLLFILTTLAGVEVGGLMASLLVVLVVCLLVALRIPPEYRAALRSALEKRSLDGLTLLPTDAATIHILESGLRDESPSRVLYCMKLLIERDPDAVADALVLLLDHPSDIIRRTALTRITEKRAASALPHVERLAASDSSAEVRAAAVVALAALLENDSVEALLPYLDDFDPVVKQSAIIGLLRSGGIEGVLAGGEHLLILIHNTDPSQRAASATVIGKVGIPSFYRPLRSLLLDDAVEVQRAALGAARALGTPSLTDEVVICLGSRSLRASAGAALAAMGDAAIPRILQSYASASADLPLRELLLRTLAQINSNRARSALEGLLGDQRTPERASLAAALVTAGFRAERRPAVIAAGMEAAGRDASWALVAANQIVTRDDAAILVEGLHQFVDRQRDAMLSLMACVHSADLLKRVISLLDWSSAAMRAYAVELLDNTLTVRERAVLLPLIDGSGRQHQRIRLESQFPVEQRTVTQWLAALIEGDLVPATPWLRCAALHATRGDSADSYQELVHGLVSDPDPVVRRSAELWMEAVSDKEGQVRRASMLSVVERVILLKAIPIFAEIPDSDLAELADRLREQRVDADTPILVEGEIGTSMYVVASGTVRIHYGDEEVARMGEGSVFGELAALDPQPRVASVTTVDETLLFSVEQDSLYELMAEHPVMLRGIIKILCERLRERHSAHDQEPASLH